jgi:hypothetical protein
MRAVALNRYVGRAAQLVSPAPEEWKKKPGGLEVASCAFIQHWCRKTKSLASVPVRPRVSLAVPIDR